MPETSNQRMITSHAVFTGLTPLIPIPIVDDLVKSYFQRRLVRKLGEAYSITLDERDVKTLADDPGGGCLTGCLGSVLLFPFKLIFRKLFFFLEWKRAVDTVSLTFHQGYLLDHALKQGWYPGPRTATDLRGAVDTVCREVGTGAVGRAVKVTFGQSKNTIKSAAAILERSMRGIKGEPDEEWVRRAAESVEPEERRQIEGVMNNLEKSIEDIPPGYFDDLRARLAARLQVG